MKTMNRNTYYALIHAGFNAYITAKTGVALVRGELDAQYRNWLEERTGQRSCKPLTYAQLTCLVNELKAGGWLKNSRNYKPGGSAPGRPTEQQWRKLAALSHERGWQGLDSPSLNTFVQRTVGLAGTRFLTKSTISAVISGLEKWLRPNQRGHS